MTSCAVPQPRIKIGPEDAVFAFYHPHRASAGRREGVPPRFRARHPAEIAAALGLDGGLIAGELSRETAERVAQAAREETGASHALAVLIEVDDGPDRIDFGGSIHLAIAAEDGIESRRSRIYGGRLGAVELGLDCLRRYLQGLPVTERADFERV